MVEDLSLYLPLLETERFFFPFQYLSMLLK